MIDTAIQHLITNVRNEDPRHYEALVKLVSAINSVALMTPIRTIQYGLSDNVPDGQLVYIEDYNHMLIKGVRDFTWAPGDLGSGYYARFEGAPVTRGWVPADGSTVQKLNSDGSLSKVVTQVIADTWFRQ